MPTSTEQKQAVGRAGKVWVLFFGSLALIILSMIFGWFDTTTELYPAHDRVDETCLVLAAVCGVTVCAAAIYLTKGLTVVQRIVLPVVLLFEAGVGIWLIAGHVASIVEGRIDFPSGKTRTYQGLLLISRAYQTHGKSASQYIQTTPIWTNLEITDEDFAFMRAHRRPDDPGKNPDEIKSNGYFCAKVTLEQSQNAMRILHAGSEKLPRGTVIRCPVLSWSR